MSFWTAMAVITLGIVALQIGRAWLIGRDRAADSARQWADLGRRLDALEQRTANLETLLLEDAKQRRFDALRDAGD